jgi:glycosyltransferase involved in cell wall biosynthesis
MSLYNAPYKSPAGRSHLAKGDVVVNSNQNRDFGARNSFTSKDVLLIVPAFNEQDSIIEVVQTIERSGYSYLVVNDGSTDSTSQLLEEANASHVNLVENLGIGGAVQTGYKYALRNGYQIAVQFDGDGQHDISYVDKLIQPILAGKADISVGSRFVGSESAFRSSFARRVGIKILSGLLKITSGSYVYDVTSGFRAVNRKTMAAFARSYPIDYPEPESLAYALARGFKVAEVPVAMHERLGGTSSISGLGSMYYMVKVGLSILIAGVKRPTRRRK